MKTPVVLIIGCGIAGPVLGIFYKRKGYHAIVFEKVKELGDAGASIMLMPNGRVFYKNLQKHKQLTNSED